MAHHHSYKTTVTELKESSEVEIKSAVPAEEFAEHIKETLQVFAKEVTIPGFRKGSAPEKLVREKISEASLLSEAAESAIAHAYGHILDVEKIDAVGRPMVSITKMAEGNPLEFTIRTGVLPKIEKLDYAKIAKAENAKKSESIDVSDDDVEKALENIRKGRAITKKEGEEAQLPELNDEFAKSLGDFKDVADLKSKVKENLVHEKEHRAKEKKRLALIEAIAGAVPVTLPRVMIESELDRMIAQMRHDIERMGLSFDEYLKHLKKSEADMRKEWEKDAEKKAKLDLALEYIAKEEKIVADKTKVDAEMKHIVEQHKDIDLDRAHAYFEHAFQTQAVFDYLESVK
jgi:FKBP-type peptidyl-prolyl cis-trans isomerase (trigger factor)